MVGGFKNEFLNINFEEDAFFHRSMALSEVQFQKTKEKSISDYALAPTEVEHAREFFDEEIRGQDTHQVLQIYQRLFSQLKHPLLRQIMLENITTYKGNDFTFFQKLVIHCVSSPIASQ